MAARIRNRAGSVLPSVLMFAVIAAITVFAFVSGQFALSKPTLSAPRELQALCNARSGIWKALEMLRNHGKPDSLKGINTLDTAFTNHLFDKNADTSAIPKETLMPDSSPVSIKPFSCDSFGACEVSLSYFGCFERLSSKGTFGNIDKIVTVTLGGVALFPPDTVYYLEKGAALQGSIWGKGHIGPDSLVIVRQDELTAMLSRYIADLSAGADTMVPQPPLTIQHNDEFEKIPDFVKGPLFIDGSHFDLSWKQKRRVTVLGDVQITGKVKIDGVELIASGEIKCFDDCTMNNVTLLAVQRVVMADRAIFNGTAIAGTNMLFYGHASVERRSMLIATGEAKTPKQMPVKNGPLGHNPPKPSRKPFSITVTENSIIDATVISLKNEIGGMNELGVKIDKNAEVKGVVWTNGYFSLLGKLFGVIHASAMVDPATAMTDQQLHPSNILSGAATIRPIEDLNKYHFPFFMGRLSIIQWQE